MADKAPAANRGRKASGEIEPAPIKRRRGRPFSDYSAALRYLDDRVNIERIRAPRVDRGVFKLDRMRAMLATFGDPHDSLRFVHVAGSKGKGSVCEMVASCLGACGYTVGLFTSPHLVDVRERVRVAGEMIDEESFTRVMSRCRDAARAVTPAHGEPTYFELITLASILHFAESAVDIAVMEVGLGGRLDSTNVIKPLVTAVTEIQLEHTDLLGETVEEIAAEKAGIFKAGVPAVTCPQTDGVEAVLRGRAEAAGCELAVLGKEIDYSVRFEAAHQMSPHARVCVSTGRSAYDHLASPLPGEHQAANCGVALAILDRLRGLGFSCEERDVATGLARTPRHGRAERVWETPRVIIDGAHTHESVRALINALGASETFDSMVVIFGCAVDKNVGAMLDEVSRGADKIIFTAAESNPRAMQPHDLASLFAGRSEKMAQVEPDVRSAINAAARAVSRDDIILVTGSFHLAGEAKSLFEAKRQEVAPAAV